MKSWKTFESTVSEKSWIRIDAYIEAAQEQTELSDYPNVTSWYDMAAVLSMYENNIPADSKYDDLIKDYKTYMEALGD